jgi:hypothetical protein
MVLGSALHKNLPSTSVDVAVTKGWLDSELPNSPQGLRFRPDHDISIQAIHKGENKHQKVVDLTFRSCSLSEGYDAPQKGTTKTY